METKQEHLGQGNHLELKKLYNIWKNKGIWDTCNDTVVDLCCQSEVIATPKIVFLLNRYIHIVTLFIFINNM